MYRVLVPVVNHWETFRSNRTVALNALDPVTVKLWYQYPLTVWLARKLSCTYTRPPGFPPAACHAPLACAPFSQSAYVHGVAAVLKPGFVVLPDWLDSVNRASWTCSQSSLLVYVLR